MTLVGDFLALCEKAVEILFTDHRQEAATAVGIGVLLAALCWSAATRYSQLWNLRFRVTLRHHILCFVAAVGTFLFALLFASVPYTEQAARGLIAVWEQELPKDRTWQDVTFLSAYNAVKNLGLEPPDRFRPPSERFIPTTHPESQSKAAEVYINSAVADFQTRHPFLSLLLRVPSIVPKEKFTIAMREFFEANPGEPFPLREGIRIATTEIRSDLQTKTARVVWASRLSLIALFIGVQLIPFGLIGYEAYRDLKIFTAQYGTMP